MGFRSKMKVAGFVLLKVRMKNYGTSLRRIYNFFMLHFEVMITEGLDQKSLGVVIGVTKKVGWEVLKVIM
jgi:hypothetical protein